MDLAWYLAVNCDRLPETKEDVIGAYREALETARVSSTAPWWDEQSAAAALAGAFLQLGWSKTGDAVEFGWWSERLAAWAAVITDPSNAYQGAAGSVGPVAPQSCTTRWRPLRLQRSRASFRAPPCSMSAPGPALCAVRSALSARSPFAVDTSPDMLGEVGEAAVLAVAGDMCALPFTDRCFDAAVSGFAISHIDAPERALDEMRRVIRPRGRVIATVFGAASMLARRRTSSTRSHESSGIAPHRIGTSS